MNLQNKETRRLREQTYGCWREYCGEVIVKELGMDMYTLLYLKRITHKDLLYTTGNSAQCYMVAWMGEKPGEGLFVYVWLSLFAVHLKLSPRC